jgi:hypothetical protein
MVIYEKFFSKIIKPNITLKEIESRIEICNRAFVNDQKKNKAMEKVLEYESKSFTIKHLNRYNNEKKLIADKKKKDDKKKTLSRRTSMRMNNILRKKSVMGMEGMLKADIKSTLKQTPTKLPAKGGFEHLDTINEKNSIASVLPAPKKSI